MIYNVRDDLAILLGKEGEIRAQDFVLVSFLVGNTQRVLPWLLRIAIPETETRPGRFSLDNGTLPVIQVSRVLSCVIAQQVPIPDRDDSYLSVFVCLGRLITGLRLQQAHVLRLRTHFDDLSIGLPSIIA